MNLTFDESFDETIALGENASVIRELQKTADAVSHETAQGMHTEELLDVMECLNTLMTYYAVRTDFHKLEPVMRKQQYFLNLCKERNVRHIGYAFLKMAFLRANALLYSNSRQLQQTADYYAQAVPLAENCFSLLQHNTDLSETQKLYVGWNCILTIREAADTEEMLARHLNSVDLLRKTLPMLLWLEPFLLQTTDICDRIASLYAGIGGIFFSSQDIKNANICYQHAINLYETIDNRYGSDFFRAKAIWIKSEYGKQRIIFENAADILEECRTDTESFFTLRNPSKRDRAIVEGARGNLLLCKSCSCQVNGDLQSAISYGERACRQFELAFHVLEDIYKDATGYAKNVLGTIVNQLYAQLISGSDSLGVQYYGAENYESAENALLKAVSLITDKPEYTIGETASITVQAECYQYLTLISFNEGNAEQAEFYGKNAAAMANQAAEAINNPMVTGLAVTVNGLMAEFYLNMKNKNAARQYSETGLHYCAKLRALNPQSPQLQMENVLQKILRKASRKFF